MARRPTTAVHRYREIAQQAASGRWRTENRERARSGLGPEAVVQLPAGDHPEGVAVDPAGTVYLSNRRFVGGNRKSEVLRIGVDGRTSLVARLADTVDPLGNGVLGLATDSQGNVYAALDSRDPASRGIWRISPDGAEVKRLVGSQTMSFPNALAFDAAGNLYATDSQLGAIWRFPWDESSAPGVWVRHELLAPFPFDPFALPLPDGGWRTLDLPGANGIAFHPPNRLYVANTEKGLIVEVTIGAGGAAGLVRIVAGEPIPDQTRDWLPDPRLWTVDGIAVDGAGQLHAVVPGWVVLAKLTGARLSPLIRVVPGTSEVHFTTVDAQAFHTPLSLAFGRTPQDRKSVFITNSALFSEFVPGPGPGLIRAVVGVAGP